MPSAALKYENITAAIGTVAAIAAVWALAMPLLPAPWDARVAKLLTLGAVLTLGLDVLIFNRWRQKHFRAYVTADAFAMERGRLLRTTCDVRREAVLSVDVEVGPLLRKFGLARVKLNGIAAFPDIPPLSLADAEKIKTALTAGRT